MTKLDSQMIVIFGGTGDLTRRKLIPSLYHLERKGQLTSCTPIVCLGRQEFDRAGFLASLDIESAIEGINREVWQSLAQRIEYRRIDLQSVSVAEFAQCLAAVRKLYACADNTLVYLALPTEVFAGTARFLQSLHTENGWLRVAFEKPFGEDLQSAVELHAGIRSVLAEEQIFRVDHYLGKELVRDILTLRFTNAIFLQSWDRTSIDHVQITVSETLGVEKRAGYYDRTGAVRDMAQNHLLQLLAFVAMEPPQEGSAEAFRDGSVEVLRHLRPARSEDVVLGQYEKGWNGAEEVVGYRNEPGIPPSSETETYVAFRAMVDMPRWQGVPFYLRTGKRLHHRFAEIRVQFRQSPPLPGIPLPAANAVVIRIQPDEGIALTFNIGVPGEIGHTEAVVMDFCHQCHFGPNTPEAYESILRNVMEGERSNFPRWDWIEASWRYVDGLRARAAAPLPYPAGSYGPTAADALLAQDGRGWFNGEDRSPVLTPLSDLKNSRYIEPNQSSSDS
jgi:glucose-6-phosphate 1-dehydrogenase